MEWKGAWSVSAGIYNPTTRQVDAVAARRVKAKPFVQGVRDSDGLRRQVLEVRPPAAAERTEFVGVIGSQRIYRVCRVVYGEYIAVPRYFPVAGAGVELIRSGQAAGENGSEGDNLALVELCPAAGQA